MDLDAFSAAHRDQWERLDVLVGRGHLSGAETDELVVLYRTCARHLSRVRSAAPDPQQQAVDAALHAAIAASPSREALLDLWGRSQNAWTDAHTAAVKQRLQQLTN